MADEELKTMADCIAHQEEFMRKILTYKNGCIEYLGISSDKEKIKVISEKGKLKGNERIVQYHLFNYREIDNKFIVRYSV